MPVVGEVTYARGTEDDPSVGTLVLCRPHAGDRPAGLLLGSARRATASTCRDDGHARASDCIAYTFPASARRGRTLRLGERRLLGQGDRYGHSASRTDSTRISGWRYSTGWAKDQRVYFAAEFSKPVKNISYCKVSKTVPEEGDITVKGRCVRVELDTTDGEQLLREGGACRP